MHNIDPMDIIRFIIFPFFLIGSDLFLAREFRVDVWTIGVSSSLKACRLRVEMTIVPTGVILRVISREPLQPRQAENSRHAVLTNRFRKADSLPRLDRLSRAGH